MKCSKCVEELFKLSGSIHQHEAIEELKSLRTSVQSMWKCRRDSNEDSSNFDFIDNRLKEIIEKSVEQDKDEIMFHEANACPDFWEQTRIIANINLAVPLIKCAKSVEGWSIYQRMKERQSEDKKVLPRV